VQQSRIKDQIPGPWSSSFFFEDVELKVSPGNGSRYHGNYAHMSLLMSF
jgi:hypothetical protein